MAFMAARLRDDSDDARSFTGGKASALWPLLSALACVPVVVPSFGALLVNEDFGFFFEIFATSRCSSGGDSLRRLTDGSV